MIKKEKKIVIRELDNEIFRKWILKATDFLNETKEQINNLNVFPVPDGDTGTNMFLTMKSVCEYMDKSSIDMKSTAESVSKGALMGARGNSGVILAQMFQGIFQGIEKSYLDKSNSFVSESGSLLPKGFLEALSLARECSYQAVSNPQEGTMLSVIRSIEEIVGILINDGVIDFSVISESIVDRAYDALQKTPEQLSILKQAKVVDAGGQGILHIFVALLAVINDQNIEELSFYNKTLKPIISNTKKVISREFLESTMEEEYGYCSEVLLKDSNIESAEIRKHLESISNSVVVAGTGSLLKIHFHAELPGDGLNYLISVGTVQNATMQNMDEQHDEVLESNQTEITTSVEHLVIAISSGDGFNQLYKEQGCFGIVANGKIMNPSVEQIHKMLEKANSNSIILLPNDKNNFGVCNEAIGLVNKKVEVIQSRSLPEGLTAMFNYDKDESFSNNVELMKQSLGEINTIEIASAIKDVSMNSLSVKQGDFVCIHNQTLISAGKILISVIKKGLKKVVDEDSELLTVYFQKKNVSTDNDLVSDIQKEFPSIEIELVFGGQTQSLYIITIE